MYLMFYLIIAKKLWQMHTYFEQNALEELVSDGYRRQLPWIWRLTFTSWFDLTAWHKSFKLISFIKKHPINQNLVTVIQNRQVYLIQIIKMHFFLTLGDTVTSTNQDSTPVLPFCPKTALPTTWILELKHVPVYQ